MKPDRWLPIRGLLKRVRADSPAGARVIFEEHFEFRGGLGPRNPAWPELRQRASDAPPSMPRDAAREGRLRYVHAELYQGVAPEEWLPARELRDEVIDHRRLEEAERPTWRRGVGPLSATRVLPDNHFAFRFGVRSAGSPRFYTRRDDLTEPAIGRLTS